MKQVALTKEMEAAWAELFLDKLFYQRQSQFREKIPRPLLLFFGRVGNFFALWLRLDQPRFRCGI